MSEYGLRKWMGEKKTDTDALTAPSFNWALAYLCAYMFDELYLYQNVQWKHTAATKPITYVDDDDENDDDTLQLNEMIIIVGFDLIALHFILAKRYLYTYIIFFIRFIGILCCGFSISVLYRH